MDWTQAFTVIGVFVGGVIYLLSKMDANQKETNARFNGIENRFNGIENRLTALEVEIKNINQRLAAMETENKDVSKRLSNMEGCLMPKKVFHFDSSAGEKDPREPKEN